MLNFKTRPSDIYFSRPIKEEFINDKFQEENLKNPRPKKGTKYDHNKLETLKSDSPVYYEFLENMRNMYFGYQTMYEKNSAGRRGNFLPAMRKTSQERSVDFFRKFTTSQNESWWNWVKETLSPNPQDLEEEGITEEIDMYRDKVPTYFTSQIDAENQSDNILFSIFSYGVRAFNYSKTKDIQPILDASLIISDTGSTVETKKGQISPVEEGDNFLTKVLKTGNKKIVSMYRKPGTSSIHSLMEEIVEKEIFGKHIKRFTPFGENATIDVDKAYNKLLQFSGFNVFFGNMFSPLKNMGGATMQNLIDAGKDNLVSSVNYALGAADATRIMSKMSTQMNRVGKKDLMIQVLDLYGFTKPNIELEVNRASQWNGVMNAPRLGTALKEASEIHADITYALAAMRGYKINNSTSLLDAFYLDAKGNVKIKEDLDISEKEIRKFAQKVNNKIILNQGAYEMRNKTMAERRILGRSFLFMSQYLLPGYNRRFGTKRQLLGADMTHEGFYLTALNLLKNTIINKGGLRNNWETLTAEEKKNIVKIYKDAGFIIALFLIIKALKPGDDDEEITTSRKLLLAFLMGVSTEMQVYTPAASGTELARKGNNPFIFARQIIQVVNTVNYGIGTISGSEDAYYKRKTGIHEKGDSKFMANLGKLFTYGKPSNITSFNPDQLYKTQKSLYEGAIIR